MAKSIEQKAADALEAGVRDVLWSPQLFARHILNKDLAVQWMLLRTVIVLIKEWRKESKPEKYRNFSDYMDEDVDEIVDLSPWDT